MNSADDLLDMRADKVSDEHAVRLFVDQNLEARPPSCWVRNAYAQRARDDFQDLPLFGAPPRFVRSKEPVSTAETKCTKMAVR